MNYRKSVFHLNSTEMLNRIIDCERMSQPFEYIYRFERENEKSENVKQMEIVKTFYVSVQFSFNINYHQFPLEMLSELEVQFHKLK